MGSSKSGRRTRRHLNYNAQNSSAFGCGTTISLPSFLLRLLPKVTSPLARPSPRLDHRCHGGNSWEVQRLNQHRQQNRVRGKHLLAPLPSEVPLPLSSPLFSSDRLIVAASSCPPSLFLSRENVALPPAEINARCDLDFVTI